MEGLGWCMMAVAKCKMNETPEKDLLGLSYSCFHSTNVPYHGLAGAPVAHIRNCNNKQILPHFLLRAQPSRPLPSMAAWCLLFHRWSCLVSQSSFDRVCRFPSMQTRELLNTSVAVCLLQSKRLIDVTVISRCNAWRSTAEMVHNVRRLTIVTYARSLSIIHAPIPRRQNTVGAHLIREYRPI